MSFFFEEHALFEEEHYLVNSDARVKSFPAHLHRAYELLLVNQGTLRLKIDQKEYTLEANDLAFIFPYQIHSLISSKQLSFTTLIFSPEIINEYHAEYKDCVPANNIFPAPSWLNLSELEGKYNRKGVLYILCHYLLKATKMEPVSSMANITALQHIFAYVENNYGDDCTLKNAAGLLQYDYSYLSALFRRHTGISFTAYLNNYRIVKACSMLGRTDMTVSKVSELCGYANLRTFHRNFRKVMGCAPQDYRHTAP